MLRNKLICVICIIALLLVNCGMPCLAATSPCQLTVWLEDGEKQPIDQIQVSVCKVASISETDYFPAEGFETSGISISGVVNHPSAENAQSLLEYVKENNINRISVKTTDGKAYFSSLDMGIWLVFCEEGQEHQFKPFFVFLPQIVNGEISYEVFSTPKTEENHPNQKSIYVVKKWEDNNNAARKRPDSITVSLKLDGTVINTITLDAASGWSHIFTNLPEQGTYTIEEQAVSNYTIAYNGDAENGFVITNTYKSDGKLPQTGQLWWPIGLLVLAGGAFVVLGVIELKGKRHAEKKA